jgi:phosphatidylinositol glycan class N
LEGVGGSVAIPRVTRLLEIEELIGQKDWFNARLRTAELIKHGLAALRYLETYDRFLIWGIVTAAYLGWFAYSSLYVFRPPSPLPSRASSVITLVMILAALGFWACFAIQKSPWTFYIYILFPFYFWHQFFRQAVHSYGTWMHHRPRSAEELVRAGLWGALVIVVLQSMAVSTTALKLMSR